MLIQGRRSSEVQGLCSHKVCQSQSQVGQSEVEKEENQGFEQVAMKEDTQVHRDKLEVHTDTLCEMRVASPETLWQSSSVHQRWISSSVLQSQ